LVNLPEDLCAVLDHEMTIIVRNLAKRYNRNTIFKNLSAQFEQEKTYAILGPNGSGKSTLLKVLAAITDPDEGEITYQIPNYKKEHIYQTVGYVAPYIDIPEEYTFPELLSFHSKFKQPRVQLEEVVALCGLSRFEDTPIKEYSSGMKQRVKLSLVLFFKNLISVYDEPCSHLDKEGFDWYNEHVQNHVKHGLVLIGSNNPEEYKSADVHIDIQSFK